MRRMDLHRAGVGARIRIQHFLDRFAKLAFRIEHELAGGDDALAFL